MSATAEIEAGVITSTRRDDPLQTKYYCQLDKPQNLHVVMEMMAPRKRVFQRIPLRYVLVIDVSGSMEQRIGRDQMQLLDRVKLFVDLVIKKINVQDSLAIVAFANYSQTVLRMTQMTAQNKAIVKQIPKSLRADGGTNLESGLLEALNCFKTSYSTTPTRDCIILFTDGEANNGETRPKQLIEKFRKEMSKLKRASCIPVSAFTIGGYQPTLLIEVARHLGSEAFYWMNEEHDFEADMLIPLFLREITHVTDIDVTLRCLANSYFERIDYNAQHLETVERHKVKIRRKNKKKKESLPTVKKYFIHSLPDDNKRNLQMHIVIPGDKLQVDVSILDVIIKTTLKSTQQYRYSRNNTKLFSKCKTNFL